MNLNSLANMVTSSEAGWRQILKSHPAILRIFLLLVLPLSILPPVMLYYAGTKHGDAFLPGFAAKPWGLISPLFFGMELATFVLMGWFIRQVAVTYQIRIDYYDAYLVAAIAPVPLWLSSLGLLVPSLIFNAAVLLTAVGMSCALIYHGISTVSRREHDVEATTVVQIVMGAGLIAWALLFVSVLPIS
jgi:hypothetical protein